jgi:hypothetical protein
MRALADIDSRRGFLCHVEVCQHYGSCGVTTLSCEVCPKHRSSRNRNVHVAQTGLVIGELIVLKSFEIHYSYPESFETVFDP